MKIIEKLKQKAENNWDAPAVTIAFLGDSVTQGCFELYLDNNGTANSAYDKNCAYHQYIARIFALLYPSVPVNVLNAGISGGNAPHALERLERNVLRHHPDLTVVCFGLNDACSGAAQLPRYVSALRQIFTQLRESGSEIIFMTPNMMGTSVSGHLSSEVLKDVVRGIIPHQLNGDMDAYMDAARALCRDMDVPLCDCYAKWKKLHDSGVDTTHLLANYVNHPTREMNWMFAYSLVETMYQ